MVLEINTIGMTPTRVGKNSAILTRPTRAGTVITIKLNSGVRFSTKIRARCGTKHPVTAMADPIRPKDASGR